mmetsp:Transcript_138833/g.443215  ORF Transcript_138833/g.443215 Transcript_138833/m.443215 type:complete len:102 (+) Transcript_138833:451-756(+)
MNLQSIMASDDHPRLGKSASTAASSWQLSRRIHQVIDMPAIWDVVFPESLATSAGIHRDDLRRAFHACASEVAQEDFAAWDAHDFEEAVSRLVVLEGYIAS